MTTHSPSPLPRRAFIIVIDALGIGAMPDASAYNDSLEANTLGNIDKTVDSLNLPTLASLGLGHLLPLKHVEPIAPRLGQIAKLAERSIGKDTTTGHWEMMNIILETPFPTYPQGFPQELVDAFINQTGCKGILGNKPASGTAILDELSQQHLDTGYPIIYTSADSVWQIATHIDVVPLEQLYDWCQIARALLVNEHEVSRVIARPFEGKQGAWQRIGHARHDYAVTPPTPNTLSQLVGQGVATLSIGKIKDIFCGEGITHHQSTKSNAHGLTILNDIVNYQVNWSPLSCQSSQDTREQPQQQLIFCNLVETDMNYGHRRDTQGYAKALEAIDQALAPFITAMTPQDLLILTADHGCDPTAPGSDHTREYVPFITYSPSLQQGQHLGTQKGFNLVGQTAYSWLTQV
jgi:phosphopentomutase